MKPDAARGAGQDLHLNARPSDPGLERRQGFLDRAAQPVLIVDRLQTERRDVRNPETVHRAFGVFVFPVLEFRRLPAVQQPLKIPPQ